MFHRPAAPCRGDWRDCAVAQQPRRTPAARKSPGTTRASPNRTRHRAPHSRTRSESTLRHRCSHLKHSPVRR